MASVTRKALAMLVVGLIIGAAGSYATSYLSYQSRISELEAKLEDLTSAEIEPHSLMQYIADSALSYIEQHHPKTESYVPDYVDWKGGRVALEGLAGYETYVYGGSGWNMTINCPVTRPRFTFTVAAEYESPKIHWEGTMQRNLINEKIFEFEIQPSPSIPVAEEVRNLVIEYVKERHPDAALYLDTVEWEGGRATPQGLVGHETYLYSGGNWTVTIEWNVVAPAYLAYEAIAEHANGIVWTGEVREGKVTESSYKTENQTVAWPISSGKYLFIEHYIDVYIQVIEGNYSGRIIDSPTYSFDRSSMMLRGMIPFDVNETLKIVYGKGRTVKGAGGGIESLLYGIYELPYQKDGFQISNVDSDGTIKVVYQNSTMILMSGEKWMNITSKIDIQEFADRRGVANLTITDTIVNFGILDKSNIEKW